jgi:hypothetical protein
MGDCVSVQRKGWSQAIILDADKNCVTRSVPDGSAIEHRPLTAEHYQ